MRDDDARRRRFAAVVVPHLDAAYNLARWLTRDDQEAEDVVQTASLRALRFFDGFQGTNARAWLLAIVRNSFYSALAERRGQAASTPFDEEVHGVESSAGDPETQLLRQADAAILRRGFAELPVIFREVMVLREIEGLSYREIAGIVEVPMGTVMSRLARARRHLQDFLIAQGVAGRRA